MGKPKLLLFDLGGVLIDFAGMVEVRKLLKSDPGPEGIRQRWITSSSIIKFERGACSPDEFARDFVDEWDLTVDPVTFFKMFRSWIRSPFPGAESLLVELRPNFALACLSNTNEVHWADMLDLHGLRKHLNGHYASYQIGALKPDPDVFAFVSEDMGYEPSEIVFFDDGLENVTGAREAGLDAHQVEGLEDLRNRVIDLGLLNLSG